MGAHTTSDDPTRYVPPEELAAWAARDPIDRFRSQLTDAGQWSDAQHDATVAAAEARLERTVDAALAHPVDPDTTLDELTATPSWRLSRQRDDLHARVSRAGARPE